MTVSIKFTDGSMTKNARVTVSSGETQNQVFLKDGDEQSFGLTGQSLTVHEVDAPPVEAPTTDAVGNVDPVVPAAEATDAPASEPAAEAPEAA